MSLKNIGHNYFECLSTWWGHGGHGGSPGGFSAAPRLRIFLSLACGQTEDAVALVLKVLNVRNFSHLFYQSWQTFLLAVNHDYWVWVLSRECLTVFYVIGVTWTVATAVRQVYGAQKSVASLEILKFLCFFFFYSP